MTENLVNNDSVSKLLEIIPRKDHDKIRQICQDLVISEVPTGQQYKLGPGPELFEASVTRKGLEHIYPYLLDKNETISIIKVLETIKKDYDWVGNYEEFKIHEDLEMASKLGEAYHKKEKDPDMETGFKMLQERKLKLREMFTRDEIDVIPSAAKFRIF